MVSTEDLLIGLLRPRLFRLGIERFHRVARSRSGFLFSCRSIAELEWLEQFIELVASVVTLHVGSSSPVPVELRFLAASGVLCHG